MFFLLSFPLFILDPRETKNLFENASAIELRRDLMQHLVDWLVLTSDVTPNVLDNRGPPSKQSPYPIDEQCMPEPDVPGPALDDLNVLDYYAINGVLEE